MPQALTHQMLAREAAKMLMEENPVVKNVNTDRKIEFGEEINGYKKGDTIRIKVPPVPTVFSGSNFAGGGAAPAQNETEIPLTLDTQLHVPLTFTAKEKKLDLSEFRERFLRPAINSLSSGMNSNLLVRMKDLTPNVVGTWGTIPNTRTPYRNASSRLNRFLAPSGNTVRSLHFSSDANDALAEANATLFHTRQELEAEFDQNAVGAFAGFTFFEQQSIPVHTNGAGTGYLVNGAGNTGSSLPVNTGTGAITKGSIITITGVNAVHPITGADMGVLRQFVVTADYAGGAGNLQIFPAISVTTASVVGTVSALPAAAAPITIFGTASQGKRQNLAFHRDAFAVGFAPLPVLASCEGYTATMPGGVSIRVMTFGNGLTDQENTRVDVLFGLAGVRRDWATRLTE
ncbi:P22 phage major capsid protein family protein [Lysobacter soli]|uniref:P22 phage major capsid protein family protein n=1 Tax=Lysobacter soli TaxID=453783 RepID=UPI0037C922A1